MTNKQRSYLPLILLAAGGTFHLATNIYIPALPAVTEYFQADRNVVQLSVASFLFGSATSALFYGALSDQYGRRPTFLVGLSIFFIGSLVAGLAASEKTLIIMRIFQGMGAGAISTSCITMLHETHSPKSCVRIMGWMGIMKEFMTAFSPILGGYLVISLTWKSTFIVVAISILIVLIATFKFLPETSVKAENKQVKFSKRRLFRNYKVLFMNKIWLRYTLIFPLLLSGLWAYLTVVPFYFINTLGISADLFGYYVAPTAIVYSVGSLMAPSTVKRVGLDLAINIGLSTCFAAGVLHLILSMFNLENPIYVTVVQCFYVIGMSQVFAPSISKALQTVRYGKGTATSLGSTFRQGCGAIGGVAGGLFYDGNLIQVSLYLILLSSISLAIFKGFENKDRKYG